MGLKMVKIKRRDLATIYYTLARSAVSEKVSFWVPFWSRFWRQMSHKCYTCRCPPNVHQMSTRCPPHVPHMLHKCHTSVCMSPKRVPKLLQNGSQTGRSLVPRTSLRGDFLRTCFVHENRHPKLTRKVVFSGPLDVAKS